ncbi:hypothetical protein GCM10010524_44110 [Streptomyces mexicanus]
MPDMIPHLPRVWGANPATGVRAATEHGGATGARPANGDPLCLPANGSCCDTAMTFRTALGLTSGGCAEITLSLRPLPDIPTRKSTVTGRPPAHLIGTRDT